MIRIGICEDVYEELVYCKRIVEGIMADMSRNVMVYCSRSGEDLLLEIDATGKMDIYLLDIELLGMNGVEFARRLREKDGNAVIIFISSHDQYCKEAIEVQPYAFIDKPISVQRLKEVLGHVVRTYLDQRECFSFSNRKIQFNIPLSEIRYFQSDKRLIYVWTVHNDTSMDRYAFYGKLQDVEEDISNYKLKFLRIRKSFLVNTNYIMEYTADRVVMDDGAVIEESLYVVMLPEYREEDKKIEITALMREQGIYERSGECWFFRVTKEQAEELMAPYWDAYDRAEEQMEEVTYSYEELFGEGK